MIMSRKFYLLLVAIVGISCMAGAHGGKADVYFSWGDVDIRYTERSQPGVKETVMKQVRGWRGERLSAVAEIWTRDSLREVSYVLSDLKGPKGCVIPAKGSETGFVTYVMADGLGPDGHGCGSRKDHTKFDSVLVADCIDQYMTSADLIPGRIHPVWLSVCIPSDAVPGTYKGSLALKKDGKTLKRLDLHVVVEEDVLPEPSQWVFHLDLWQNPFAVARWHDVPLWSDGHMEVMKPVMKRLADAGQKVITASITHKPWNGQVYDPYMSMVSWVKKADGSWEYGYEVFDKWVEFMMGLGIDKQINCYSMVPWRLSFQYYDEASATIKELRAKPGEPEYEEFWAGMLQDFSRHLREKGWFEKCLIAMDERPMDVMQQTIKVIRKADPDFKISLAGNWHPELEEDIHDYCIAWNQRYPEDILLKRKSEGKVSTWYTSCADAVPNSYTFSAPGESYQTIMEIISRRSDGFLRWAYNCWPQDPMTDSRYDNYASGDCFLVYPDNRSSVRFERLRDGIEEYEKMRVLGRRVLEGKTLVACGDSFTEGDFWDYVDKSGNIDSKSPEIYDKEWGCYMTYPYWIARRNGMKLVNIAKCGATLALPAQKKNECFVTDKMETIPEDADYILFKFGINDSWQVPVGSIDDTEADTFYGAWNIVLEWVRKNRPYAKVGVIASNDCKTEEYSLATAAVCLKYGIPCLDEEHDYNVPYFYSQKFKSCPEDVRHDRDSIYRVSSQNSHPNIAAHRFESHIVESFIRSL